MVTVCRNLLRYNKTNIPYSPEEIHKGFEEYKKLAEGFRNLISAHEDVITEIQSLEHLGANQSALFSPFPFDIQFPSEVSMMLPLSSIDSHQEYVNRYKKRALWTDWILHTFFLDKDQLEIQLAIFEAIDQLNESHSDHLSKLLETINKASFTENLNDLEKATVNRLIAYHEISKLRYYELSEANDLTTMKNLPLSDKLRKIEIAVEAVKEADRAYIKAHPKGEKATAMDWTIVFHGVEKKVLDFHQENRCRNSLS